MRQLLAVLAVLLFAVPLIADEPKTPPKSKVLLDNWDAAYLEGAKAGYVHTRSEQSTKDDRTVIRTTTELSLTVKRFRDTVSLRMENGTEEDQDGTVLAVFMIQSLGKDQQLLLNGTVEDKQLHVQVDEVRNGEKTRRLEKKIPWNDKVVGMYKQERLFRDRKVQPGDAFSYPSYEPSINHVVTTQVSVKDFEEVDLRGRKQRLLRVEAVPNKVEASNASIQLPAMTVWLDDDLTTARSQVEVPGLGKMNLYRTTREFAQGQSGQPAQIKDIGLSQLVRLNRKIPNAYDATQVVYRITVKGDDDASTSFARDGRQKVENAKGSTFELNVRARRTLRYVEKPTEAGEEFLKSNYFINSDDARVKAHAASAVSQETDPWRKALRIERWVHDNMQNKNFTEAFATSDHVARTLEGDCTEHAVLTAAMCRAAGIPARTAVGLIYIENTRGSSMGFHMWTEVYVKGQWVPIDATLGRGFVGASHLKIADHSWHDTQSLTPLLPVVRVVGKVGIEIVKVGGEE